jgi:hypothetical protein
VVSRGEYVADAAWPSQVAALKSAGSVTRIYASVGGGEPVVDFATIKSIYTSNGNSFAGTDLEKNFQKLHDTFKAIDGIDMDCEETYDLPRSSPSAGCSPGWGSRSRSARSRTRSGARLSGPTRWLRSSRATPGP